MKHSNVPPPQRATEVNSLLLDVMNILLTCTLIGYITYQHLIGSGGVACVRNHRDARVYSVYDVERVRGVMVTEILQQNDVIIMNICDIYWQYIFRLSFHSATNNFVRYPNYDRSLYSQCFQKGPFFSPAMLHSKWTKEANRGFTALDNWVTNALLWKALTTSEKDAKKMDPFKASYFNDSGAKKSAANTTKPITSGTQSVRLVINLRIQTKSWRTRVTSGFSPSTRSRMSRVSGRSCSRACSSWKSARVLTFIQSTTVGSSWVFRIPATHPNIYNTVQYLSEWE